MHVKRKLFLPYLIIPLKNCFVKLKNSSVLINTATTQKNYALIRKVFTLHKLNINIYRRILIKVKIFILPILLKKIRMPIKKDITEN